MIFIGCHLSASGGYLQMGKTALQLGANTFAFFTRNPRGGSVKAADPDDAQQLITLMREHSFGPLVAHAPYTVNPCAEKPETLDFARRAMREDLERLELLPGHYYNFHPGSHVGQGIDEGIRKTAETLNQAMFPGMHTTVLLETMAGKGSEIGSRFEELRRILDAVSDPDHVGVCLDTCHVYDAGYDIAAHPDDVFAEFDHVIGLNKLCAIHMNDSKNPFASHKDRHEKIGLGALGNDAFRALVRHPVIRPLPIILETPNEADGYRDEIARLRSYAEVTVS